MSFSHNSSMEANLICILVVNHCRPIAVDNKAASSVTGNLEKSQFGNVFNAEKWLFTFPNNIVLLFFHIRVQTRYFAGGLRGMLPHVGQRRLATIPWMLSTSLPTLPGT